MSGEGDQRGQGSTMGFPHVLGLPGHDTVAAPAAPAGPGTTAPPPDGAAGPDPTLGFGATLPLPRSAAPPARPDPAAADPLLAPGATLGRMRLGGLLGRRGGVTYHAAVHPVHGECRVAVLDAGGVAARGAAFLLESRLLSTAADPVLPPVLEAGAEPRPWLAQPLQPGVTLREALRREGPWPASRVLELLRDLARALSGLHAQGLTHGDLDAEQVLLPPGGGIPRLIGFGAPVCVGHLGDRQPYPGGPSLSAAPHAPPEVQAGARPSARADVWGLGLLALEAAAARPPFADGPPAEVQALVAQGPPPRAGWPALPEPLTAVVARCLHKEPGARFADAGELLRALEPLSAATARSARRALVAAALLLLAALAGGLALLLAR